MFPSKSIEKTCLFLSEHYNDTKARYITKQSLLIILESHTVSVEPRHANTGQKIFVIVRPRERLAGTNLATHSLPPASAVEVIESVPSVCVSVRKRSKT